MNWTREQYEDGSWPLEKLRRALLNAAGMVDFYGKAVADAEEIKSSCAYLRSRCHTDEMGYAQARIAAKVRDQIEAHSEEFSELIRGAARQELEEQLERVRELLK